MTARLAVGRRAMIGRNRGPRLRRGSPIGILIQVIITGISIGAVYGLFGMCLTVLYRLTGVVHLALGELAGVCVFTTLWVAYGRDAVAGEASRLPFIVGAAAGVVVAALIGALIFLVAIRPFIEQGFSLGWIGGVVASAIALRGAIEFLFQRASYTLPDPLHLQNLASGGVIALGDGATVEVRVIVVGLVALALAGGAGWLLDNSRPGAALRAVSEERLGAALCGIPVATALLVAFVVCSCVVAVVSLLALGGDPITVNTGTLLGLKGLVAAVGARFGPPRRVLVAGLVLGILETALATYQLGPLELGPAFSDVIPLALAVALLALWPERTSLQEEA
jgi:branched-chain amino acid transport system permease protein